MIRRKSLSTLFATALALEMIAAVGILPARSADEATKETPPSNNAVVAVVTRFIDAWNSHDAAALGQIFTGDCDFVGVGGILWHSPAEISRVHAEQFAGRYDQSVFAVVGAPRVAFIKPDVALIHWYWTISGVRGTDAGLLAPYGGIFTWVVVSEGGAWQIRAAQNTITKQWRHIFSTEASLRRSALGCPTLRTRRSHAPLWCKPQHQSGLDLGSFPVPAPWLELPSP
jgi:uncharacterized protein (TIGR02246 family)